MTLLFGYKLKMHVQVVAGQLYRISVIIIMFICFGAAWCYNL